MKRHFSFSAALLALFLLTPSARAQFGVAVGANFDKASDFSLANSSESFESATGYHVGVFVDLPLGPIALRPGIFYTDVGSLEPEGSFNAPKADLSLVEIPVDVRYRILLPLAKPYVLAGPVFRLANQSSDEVDLTQFSMAGAAGLGLELSLGGLRPFVEARYQFGVSKFVDGYEVGGVTIESEDDVKLNSFMIRAGLVF